MVSLIGQGQSPALPQDALELGEKLSTKLSDAARSPCHGIDEKIEVVAPVPASSGATVESAIRACQFGEKDEVVAYVEAGGSPDSIDSQGITLLHWASINGRVPIVRYLLSAGASSQVPGGVLHETALQWAAREGHATVILALVEAKCNPSCVNKYGQTALHLAAQLGKGEALLVLLACGVPVNAQDNSGFTALMYLAKLQANRIDMARVLLKYGASTDIADEGEQNTALHWMVHGNFGPFCMRWLVLAGADLTATNKQGHTPHQLALLMDKQMHAVFLANGAQVPLTPDQAPFLRGLYIPVVMLAWVLASISQAGYWGIPIGFAGVMACSPLLRRAVRYSKNLIALGVAVALILSISLAFDLVLLPEVAVLSSIAFNMFAFSCLYWLYNTHKTFPGAVSMSDEARDRFVKDQAREGKLSLNEICTTCVVEKEPRSKHCNTCGACIQIFDHHCPFVGNCVGRDNHASFIMFLGSVVVAISTFFVVLHGSSLTEKAGAGKKATTLDAFVNVFGNSRYLGCASVLAAWVLLWVGIMFLQHSTLAMRNKTTYESIKGRVWAGKHSNRKQPMRCLLNCVSFCTGAGRTDGEFLPTTQSSCGCKGEKGKQQCERDASSADHKKNDDWDKERSSQGQGDDAATEGADEEETDQLLPGKAKVKKRGGQETGPEIV